MAGKNLVPFVAILPVLCLISALPAAPSAWSPHNVLGDNPVAFYRLNDGGGGVALDSSPNGVHGTYINGAGPVTASFAGDGAAGFDGVNDYISLPATHANLPGGSWGGSAWTELTVEALVRVTADNGNTFQAALSGAGNSFTHLQLGEPAGGRVTTYTDAGILQNNPIPLAAGNWQHVAVVVKPGESRVYIDGVYSTTINDTTGGAFSHILADADVRIGSGFIQFAPDRFFFGEIDEVAIYNRALSENEILSHIPEPTALSLLGVGTIVLAYRGRRATRLNPTEPR